MAVLSAGKGESKYNIHISNKKIPKNVLNKILSTKNKVLIITDSGVPNQYLKSLKKDLALKKEPMQYTGERKLIGIATMHKSNAVPVMNKQQAKDISRMGK